MTTNSWSKKRGKRRNAPYIAPEWIQFLFSAKFDLRRQPLKRQGQLLIVRGGSTPKVDSHFRQWFAVPDQSLHFDQ